MTGDAFMAWFVPTMLIAITLTNVMQASRIEKLDERIEKLEEKKRASE